MSQHYNTNNIFYPRPASTTLQGTSTNHQGSTAKANNASLYEKILQRSQPQTTYDIHNKEKRKTSYLPATSVKTPGSIYNQAIKKPPSLLSNNNPSSKIPDSRASQSRRTSSSSQNFAQPEYIQDYKPPIEHNNSDKLLADHCSKKIDDHLYKNIYYVNQEFHKLFSADGHNQNSAHTAHKLLNYDHGKEVDKGVTSHQQRPRSTDGTASRKQLMHKGDSDKLQYNTAQTASKKQASANYSNYSAADQGLECDKNMWNRHEQLLPGRTATFVNTQSPNYRDNGMINAQVGSKLAHKDENFAPGCTNNLSCTNRYAHSFMLSGEKALKELDVQLLRPQDQKTYHQYSKPLEIAPKPESTTGQTSSKVGPAVGMAQDPIPSKSKSIGPNEFPNGIPKPFPAWSAEKCTPRIQNTTYSSSHKVKDAHTSGNHNDIMARKLADQHKQRVDLTVRHSPILFDPPSNVDKQGSNQSLQSHYYDKMKHSDPQRTIGEHGATITPDLEEIKSRLNKISSAMYPNHQYTASTRHDIHAAHKSATSEQGQPSQTVHVPKLFFKSNNSHASMILNEVRNYQSIHLDNISPFRSGEIPITNANRRHNTSSKYNQSTSRNEFTSRTENLGSALNYGNMTRNEHAYPSPASPNRNYKPSSVQDIESSNFQNGLAKPLNTNPSLANTEMTPRAHDEASTATGPGLQSSSERINAFFEEYQNSNHKSKRSRSASGLHRPVSEFKGDSKEFLSSLKEFSLSVVKSTKNFFNKLNPTSHRLKCSCPLQNENDETCIEAKRWLFSRYKLEELEYLKRTYEKLQVDAEIEPQHQKQIRLDITRTYPECKYFSAEAGGLSALQRVLECFARYDPQVGKYLFSLYLLLSHSLQLALMSKPLLICL